MQILAQYLASFALMVATALVHGLGVFAISRLLRLERSRLRACPVDAAAFGLVIAIAASLFFLHSIEIALFAAFYVWVGAIGDWTSAFFFSASAYSTLANSVEGFAVGWRIVGAIEGLVGFLMIGWSTAVFVTDMHHLFRKEGAE